MARSSIYKVARLSTRSLGQTATRGSSSTTLRALSTRPQLINVALPSIRSAFSTSTSFYKGLSPESENPKPKESESIITSMEPMDLTNEKYHELADAYIDKMVAKLEQLQEEREDVDVEYSAGVLTLTFPPIGTYVINKQPPNKQIWLSSPNSGPKRYDYVVVGESQNDKEGSGSGEWIYIRDGSTLSDVLLKEIGIDVSQPEVK